MIIGISGLAGTGKSTIAQQLVRERNFCEIGLADPMKRFCQDLFKFSNEQLWGPSAMRNALDPRYTKATGGYLSPRYALQTLGADWGRTCYENVWIDYALEEARLIGDFEWNTVISDVRFKNELEAIRKVGGEVWRVVRPGAGLTGEAGEHSSENDVQDGDCDRIILNTGTLEDLARTVKAIQIGNDYCGAV